jgi:hypothetical protein
LLGSIAEARELLILAFALIFGFGFTVVEALLACDAILFRLLLGIEPKGVRASRAARYRQRTPNAGARDAYACQASNQTKIETGHRL